MGADAETLNRGSIGDAARATMRGPVSTDSWERLKAVSDALSAANALPSIAERVRARVEAANRHRSPEETKAALDALLAAFPSEPPRSRPLPDLTGLLKFGKRSGPDASARWRDFAAKLQADPTQFKFTVPQVEALYRTVEFVCVMRSDLDLPTVQRGDDEVVNVSWMTDAHSVLVEIAEDGTTEVFVRDVEADTAAMVTFGEALE